MLVAGVDSSTTATKVLLVDAETGRIVDSGSAPHPTGTACPPQAWWDALREAGDGLIEQAAAVAVAGQQHGMVALDAAGDVVRDALLWNDTRSAAQARRLTDQFGGPRAWAEQTGSVPTAAFTIAKLGWLAEHEPDNARRTTAVLLPHDWLTMKLRGVAAAESTTDRGDASGTGYYSPAAGRYLPERITEVLGHAVVLPRVAGACEAVGRTASGAVVAPGTGDNAAAALGLGLEPGDVVVSLGTSGTVYGVSASPAADAHGHVAGFADATGRFLPLVCTLNAARVVETVARLLGADHADFDALALAAQPGAGGLTLLPYLDGERTPNRPGASGVLAGLTSGATRADLARAAVEGILAAQADGLAALAAQGLPARRVLLIGGAAASEAVRRIAPGVFGVDVHVPPTAEYVALGAARQAAWVLSGGPQPPQWDIGEAQRCTGAADAATAAQYARLREETASWTAHQ